MIPPLPRLFLHYFDVHFLNEVVVEANRRYVAEEADLATRIAVLAAEQVFVPAASYVESAICRAILDRLEPLFSYGTIFLVGGDATILDFARAKLLQYEEAGGQHEAYVRLLSDPRSSPPWYPRRRSATVDIRTRWREVGEGDELRQLLADLSLSASGIRARWRRVPAELEGRAFTPEYAVPIMVPSFESAAGPEVILARRAVSLINRQYFASFASELRAGLLHDLIYLRSGHSSGPEHLDLSFSTAVRRFREHGVLELVRSAPPEELLQMRTDPKVASCILSALPEEPHLPMQQLILPLRGIEAPLNAVLRTRSGAATATAYHRRVRAFLQALFRDSLGPGLIEHEIDEGRKRIDLLFPNVAERGTLSWVRRTFSARFVIAECKNYSRDVANPELDQVLGRFSPAYGFFGLIVCRNIHQKELFIQRCRDTYRKMYCMIIPLDDNDLSQLAANERDPGHEPMDATLLGRRVVEIGTPA